LGTDKDLDLSFVAEHTLLNNGSFNKTKGMAGADRAAVIQQPPHHATMEHCSSLLANVGSVS